MGQHAAPYRSKKAARTGRVVRKRRGGWRLHACTPARLGGYSRCACMMTCTSLLLPGSTMPLLGRTQYFLGLVVFTLKATRSPPGF